MLDVLMGGIILLLLLGFIQYIVLEGERVNRLEHRLLANILLREQLNEMEMQGTFANEREINGMLYRVQVDNRIDAEGKRELVGRCCWWEKERENTLVLDRLVEQCRGRDKE